MQCVSDSTKAKIEGVPTKRVTLTEFVEDIRGIKPSIVTQLTGNDFQGLGISGNDHLLFSFNGARDTAEVLGEFHFSGTATGNHRLVFDGATDNHDGIMEGALDFSNELLGTTTENQSASLGLGTALENVVALSTDLLFLKDFTGPEVMRGNVIHRSLNGSTNGFDSANHVPTSNSTSTENVSIGKVLSGEVSNWEFGENDFGTSGNDFFQLVVNDGPLSINNGLVVLWPQNGE